MNELWAILWSDANLNAFDLTHFTNDDNLCQNEVFTWRKIESISSTGFNLFVHQSYIFIYLNNIFVTFQGLKLKKQRSTGDINNKGVPNIRSTGSTTSWMSTESSMHGGASVASEGSNQSFAMEV